MSSASEAACAAARRELAEYAALDALCDAEIGRFDNSYAANGPTPGGRRRADRPGATGYTAVLSVRLDHPLMEALERRAALAGLATSAQARNLIRFGLSRQNALSAELVSELESLTARMRAVVP
ncbi:hypothetical protein [Jatrophihabitans endophyticus]|uniref:hypothetical protein n=1 Tax=Jatrophihabitans endophyticus TaxID=1206085 RepID=UPI0019E6C8B9|nr:hypothetical protein [Jatrophihabitans endophyticus]MBE7190396.1 hypothetical protein [Jatrophihabitans endophyticus]